jgi:hypothetical protein
MPDLLNILKPGIETHAVELWGITALCFLLLAVGFIAQTVCLKRLIRHYRTLTEGVEGTHLEEILNQHLAKVAQVQWEMQRNSQQIQELTQHESRCLQAIGLVRYDAFEDVGGKQSFAVAILDAHASGLVLSGLVGRQETRVFAKQIVEGTCSQFLSEEEQQAIEVAKRSHYGAPR